VKLGFALRLAVRESRHGFRRVGVYMAAITLGVAALVAIHSFRDDVARSVQEEADVLMGADARFEANRPLPDSVTHIIDSLSAAGVDVSRVTTTLSMVLAPKSGDVRLLQVQALQGGFPFYGEVETTPAHSWGRHAREGVALVDPAVLTQLQISLGDTLAVGRVRVPVVATVENTPTDLGYQTAVGPRVYVSQATLDSAGLLGFGSLARYAVYLRMPDEGARHALRQRYSSVLRATDVSFRLAEDQAHRLSNSIRFLGRFLGLVGLSALLLGGIGVASAVQVYVRERRPAVAVLRCLGADQWTVFAAYVLQAAALGLIGSGVGVALGAATQRVLPVLLAGVLPVPVSTRFSPAAAAAGVGIGVWVAVVFAFIPLLEIKDVPPLQALRQDFEPPRRRRDPWRIGAYSALLASVFLLCGVEAPETSVGMVFAVALLVTVALLAAVAWGLTRLTRRFFPKRASYPVRQGVSNLFRPHNQTLSVTLALGFGAFVVGTVMQVEGSLLDDLTVSFGQGRPNVLLFDVQKDQVDSLRTLLPASARAGLEVTPLIMSRITAIDGRTTAELRSDSMIPREERPRRWALRREYRNTYRAKLGSAETLVAGRWWDGTPAAGDSGRAVTAGDLVPVSLEEGIAQDLKVGLGDTISWNVGGMPVESVVTSIRHVEWSRLQPNFFAIFKPGYIDDAPQTIIMLVRIPDPTRRADFQRALVHVFPNVSALDFSRVQEAIDSVLSRVRTAVTFLALFSALAGILVLVGALATSRLQRTREGALLKTLGARRTQVLTVLFTEYLALGTLATAAGLALAWIASAIMVPHVFQVTFHTHAVPLLVIWGAVAGLTLAVGLAGSRGLLRRPPLAVLREVPE